MYDQLVQYVITMTNYPDYYYYYYYYVSLLLLLCIIIIIIHTYIYLLNNYLPMSTYKLLVSHYSADAGSVPPCRAHLGGCVNLALRRRISKPWVVRL